MNIKTWNTGRRYSAAGQRIAACLVEGTVHFHDLDRMIGGQFAVPSHVGENDLQWLTMQRYDAPGTLREDGGREPQYQHEGIYTEIQSQLIKAARAI